MLRTRLLMLAALVSAAVIVGCGDDDDDGGNPQGPPGGGGGGSDSGLVTITNNIKWGEYTYDIIAIYISLSDDSLWGENLYDDTLSYGESVSGSMPTGVYDMLVYDVDYWPYVKGEVEVGTDGYEWVVTADDYAGEKNQNMSPYFKRN